MIIYGVALLAFCSLAGLLMGEALGYLLHVKANVGGVGFAMLLLMFLTGWMARHGKFNPVSAGGLQFWGAMYLPIVVAMAAQQNVLGAIKGGWVAFFAGIVTFGVSVMLVPLINRIGLQKHLETSTWNPIPEEDRK
jgi:malonate transporter MadL subunit